MCSSFSSESLSVGDVMKKLALVFLSLAFTLSASAFADEQETKKDSFSMGESSLASFDMAYAEATKPCPREGEIGMSLGGLILSCQSDGSSYKWVSTKLTGNGEYKTGVIVPGYGSNSSEHIADSTWFCALTGLQAVGDKERARLVLKKDGWHMEYYRDGWPLRINWGCVK